MGIWTNSGVSPGSAIAVRGPACRPVVGALVLAPILALGSSIAMAQDTRFFRIGTGSIGGTYFPVGGAIANAISNPPGSPPCDRGGSCGVPGLIAMATASAGSVENLENLRAGTIDSGLVQADIAHWAVTGTGLYQGMEPQDDLRSIARLYPEVMHFVVPASSEIESIEDLAGYRVSLGDLGSGTLIDTVLVLEAHGLTTEDIDAVYLHPEPASDLMVEGEIDAFTIVGGAPLLAVEDIARRMPIRVLSMDSDAIETLVDANTFFTHETLAAGLYPGVDAWESIAVSAVWVTRADLPAVLVHDIVESLWNPSTLADLYRAHPRGVDISLDSAVSGLGVPLHEGAADYYRSIGLLDDDLTPAPELPGSEASGGLDAGSPTDAPTDEGHANANDPLPSGGREDDAAGGEAPLRGPPPGPPDVAPPDTANPDFVDSIIGRGTPPVRPQRNPEDVR